MSGLNMDAGKHMMLMDRLNKNLESMLDELQTELEAIHTHFLQNTASHILDVCYAHERLELVTFTDAELDYLLQLDNPLEFIMNNWPDLLSEDAAGGNTIVD